MTMNYEQRLIATYHRLNSDYKAARKHKLSDYFLAITLAKLNTIVRILGYTPADESETP
jgi:hypothetical protein